MKIKKGDNVIITTGKDRGKQNKVLRLYRKSDRVLVEGVNVKKKHQHPRKQGEKGQMLNVPHPIHLSNILLYCPSCRQGVRIGAKITAKKKVRVCKKCGKEI